MNEKKRTLRRKSGEEFTREREREHNVIIEKKLRILTSNVNDFFLVVLLIINFVSFFFFLSIMLLIWQIDASESFE